MLVLEFHPSVTTEIKASFFWYQEQAMGLGDDFLTELETAFHAIIEYPQTWPFLQKKFRRFLLSIPLLSDLSY